MSFSELLKKSLFQPQINELSLPMRLVRRFLFDYLPVLLILCGAFLTSVQVRIWIKLGKELGSDYELVPLAAIAIFAVMSVVAAGFGILGRRWTHVARSKQVQFYSLVLALGLSLISIMVLLPEVSLLQVLYFAILAVGIGVVTILWTSRPTNATGNVNDITFYLRNLWEHRLLLYIWILYNLRSRYSQAVLGILWIILLPLSVSLILTFVFSQVFRAFDIGGVPYISFFLVALTMWTLFSQGIMQSTVSVSGVMGLINQVYFPREILILIKLGEALVDLLFTFSAMLIINMFVGILPNINYLYLPFILLIQIAFTLGCMLFISYLTVLVRDIPQLVNVMMQLLFYITPIIYPPQNIPDHLRFIVLINPMAPIIEAYRSIITYNQPPSLVSLYYPITVSVVLLYTGYMFFKANEGRLADFV